MLLNIFFSGREKQTAMCICHSEEDNKMQQSSDGIANMRKIEWLHIHNALLQSALLNQTAWKRGTLSFQMTLIYHVGLCCFCSSSILVYGSVDTAAQCLLTLHDPEGCPVLCLKHSSRFLFAGLRNGTMRVYGRSNSGKVPPRLRCFQTDGSSFVSAILLPVAFTMCGLLGNWECAIVTVNSLKRMLYKM